MTRYERRIRRILLAFSASFVLFLLLLALAEHHGLSRFWLGPIFIFSTVMMYAVIGIRSRTTDPEEYYVAGRRIPAMYNGMAAAADWMSAASFISMAGGLYLQGYGGNESQPGGLAYVLGWTGGFCLVALLIAPHLRRLNLYTVPDYFAVRFGGRGPRIIAALAAVLCSFLYVVAQIYGIGLIASRLTGVQFEIGILLGIGGVLLCSFLGGMKAITWTQVAQYVVMLLAFLIPLSWLAYRQLGDPAAPLAYGRLLPRISALEDRIARDPAERQVAAIFLARGREYEARLRDVEGSLASERAAAQRRVRELKQQGADSELVFQANRALAALPRDAQGAREQWTRAMNESYDRAHPLGGVPRHSQPFAGDPKGSPDEREAFELSRRNFLALMFCLMVGTAGLPHLLTRYYTTPSVSAARSSVAWSLFFISLVYVSAPALAALVKFQVMNELVGSSFASLPPWIAQWARVDPSLISVADVNGDGILQWGEIRLGADIIMLATPELGGLPYVISGLVAAGGLAAALSTADGLLLTISNALVHDIVCHDVQPSLRPQQAVILSKFALMAVALVAAVVASAKPAEILPLVSASFSLAGAAFVPAMVLGMLWRGTNRVGAVAGMLAGLGITVYYMASNAATVRAALGLLPAPQLWFGIRPLSAGVFGVPLGFAVTWLASVLTRRT
jgi:cation/acetate symporter